MLQCWGIFLWIPHFRFKTCYSIIRDLNYYRSCLLFPQYSTSNPGQFPANSFIIMILQICFCNSECSVNFCLQMGHFVFWINTMCVKKEFIEIFFYRSNSLASWSFSVRSRYVYGSSCFAKPLSMLIRYIECKWAFSISSVSIGGFL